MHEKPQLRSYLEMTEFSKKVCRRANRHVSYNAPGYPGTHSPVCKISRQPPFLPFAQSPVSTCCVSRKASQCTQPERSVDSKTMPVRNANERNAQTHATRPQKGSPRSLVLPACSNASGMCMSTSQPPSPFV